MAISLSLFYLQLNNLIPSIPTSNEVSEANLYQQIKQAVIDYSKLKPDFVVTDLAGAATRYYAINTTNLPGYSDEFSRIRSIEYPAQAIADNETPVYLEPEDWDEDYYQGANRYLFLPNHQPAVGETMRITYPGLYTWTAGGAATAVTQANHGFSVNDYVYKIATNSYAAAGSSPDLLATHRVTAVGSSSTFTATELTCSVPESDFFTICNRAACLVCRAIATRYSRTSDSTINADSVAHQTRAQAFAARAKEFCGAWSEAMGIGSEDGTGDYTPASEWVDFDTFPGWPSGRRFIFHGGDVR